MDQKTSSLQLYRFLRTTLSSYFYFSIILPLGSQSKKWMNHIHLVELRHIIPQSINSKNWELNTENEQCFLILYCRFTTVMTETVKLPDSFFFFEDM